MQHVDPEIIDRRWRGLDWGTPMWTIIRRSMPNGINRRLVWWPEHERAAGSVWWPSVQEGIGRVGGRMSSCLAVLTFSGSEQLVTPHEPPDDRQVFVDELVVGAVRLTQVSIRKLAHVIARRLDATAAEVVQCCPNIGRGGLRHTMLVPAKHPPVPVLELHPIEHAALQVLRAHADGRMPR